MTAADVAVERVVREDYARILATLIRLTGDVTLAEDAVQEALVKALETWQRSGPPDQPRAWLITVARRCAIDRIRRESLRDTKEAEAVGLMEQDVSEPDESVMRDDLLRLVFTCCHPSLSPEAQVALSLRTLGGLDTPAVARALLVPEATMAKRLTRAKQKIRQARIPYRVPADDELPDRLGGVLATAYLMFNEGYAAGPGAGVVRPELIDESVRLARLLHGIMPDEAGVTGLLALMLLHDSRRGARTAADGSVIALADQDRALWDQTKIREGIELTGEGLRRSPDRPDPYVVQAAIAACHSLAPTYAATDWDAVLSWYDVLIGLQDSPTARLGRAAAVAERDGAQAGLAAVEAIDGLDAHAWWHASRAELLVRLDRPDEAEAALDRALDAGLNPLHATHIRRAR
jgi:RNA polymerase sigma factor (sigma-70 family)